MKKLKVGCVSPGDVFVKDGDKWVKNGITYTACGKIVKVIKKHRDTRLTNHVEVRVRRTTIAAPVDRVTMGYK